MKITGRNITRRLYGLRTLPSTLKRMRYFRGHGVHSPFVYNIVRQVFMCRNLKCDDHPLYDALLELNVPRRRCIQLQNLLTHCHYTTWGIDVALADVAQLDMAIVTTATPPSEFAALAEAATAAGTTLCILSPMLDRERHSTCKSLVESHRCTSVDNRAYLLLFNNHLPKQIFRL